MSKNKNPFQNLKKGYIYKDNRENIEYIYLGKFEFFSYQLDALDYSKYPCANYKIELFYSKLRDKYKGVLMEEEFTGLEEYIVTMAENISFLFLTKPNIEYNQIGFVSEEEYNIILNNYMEKYGLRYFEKFSFDNKFDVLLTNKNINEYLGWYKLYKKIDENKMFCIELSSKYDKKLDKFFFNNLIFSSYEIKDKNIFKIKEVDLELTKANFNSERIPEEIKFVNDILMDFPMPEFNVVLKKIDFFKMIDYLNKNEFYSDCYIEFANKIKIPLNI